MADRRFDEQQIGAILQRAAEIQSGLAPETGAQGLTLTELQKIASEVGIEPHLVERAAREVETHAAVPMDLGRSVSGMLDQTVAGGITEEQWEDTVIELRRFAGQSGVTSIQGNTREWTSGYEIWNINMTASVRNGQTRFRMLLDTTGVGVLGWILGSIVGILSMAMLAAVAKKTGMDPIVAALSIGFAALSVGLVTHFGIRRLRKRINRKMVELFRSVIANVSRTEPAALEAVEETPEIPVYRNVGTRP